MSKSPLTAPSLDTGAAAASAADSVRQGLMRLTRGNVLLPVAIVLLIGWLTVGPLINLTWEVFWSGTELSTAAFREAVGRSALLQMAGNSLGFALGSAAFSLLAGTTLAYLAVRTNVPFKGLLFVSSLVPLIVPNVLYTIAWIYLASPRLGLINSWLEPIFGEGAINIFTMPGMILIQGFHFAPLVFLLMYAAFKSMDPSLEEAALMSGASMLTIIRRVTIPLVRPALYAALLVMVVKGLESFEVPALIGMPNGIMVFSSRIWRALSSFPPDRAAAGSFSLILLALTTLGIFWNSRVTGRSGRSYQTVTGKGFRPRPMDVGRWRRPLGIFVIAYFVVAVALPLFILIYASTQAFYRPVSWASLTSPSWDNYRAVFSDSTTMDAFKNSFQLGVGAATAIMVVMLIASWLVVRSRVRGRWLIDLLAFLPLTIPGLVLGLAVLTIYIDSALPVYGTLWILFIAYFTRYMPYGMRYATTSMIQVGAELEESARMSGASWLQVMRRIYLPLILPGLVAGWIYILTLSVRELAASLLLYSPGNEVLSVAIWDLWENGQFPTLSALGVVLITVLVVLALAAQRLASRMGIDTAA